MQLKSAVLANESRFYVISADLAFARHCILRIVSIFLVLTSPLVFVTNVLSAEMSYRPYRISVPATGKAELFTIQLKSDVPLDAVRLEIELSSLNNTNVAVENPANKNFKQDEIEFLSDHIKWILKDSRYLEVDYFSKPRDRHLMEKFQDIEIACKATPGIEISGSLKITQFGKELQSIPLNIVKSVSWKSFLTENRYNPLLWLATVGIAIALGFSFYLGFFRKYKASRHLSLARARLSALIPRDAEVEITGIDNPFGVQLEGLGKGVKVSYIGTRITVKYDGGEQIFADDKVHLFEINRKWELKLEPQNFEKKGATEKSLLIFLIPR